MNNSGKNILVVSIVTLLFILSSSCSSTSETITQNILTTAWQTCNSITGNPTGQSFAQKAVLVWNLHPQMDYQRNNSFTHTEQIGSLWLTNAPYFILGNYSQTRYYSEDNPSDFFTLNLDEAGAFLCVSVNYSDIETCSYNSGYYIIRSTADVNVKLVSWPDKNIIAETHVVSDLPATCAPTLNTSQLGDHLVEVGNIDIWKWFSKFKR